MTIVGLGPGGPELLTREAEEVLRDATEVWLRTRQHPTVSGLPAGPRVRSFDALYRRAKSIDVVYGSIADRLSALARRPGGVVYAVPGHPLVGERSVRLALQAAEGAGLPVRIVAGLSFLEPTCAAVGLDPIADGLQVLDAAALAANHFAKGHRRDPFAARGRFVDVTRPIVLTQLDSARLVASVKLALLEQLPSEHEVVLVSGAGGGAQRVTRTPLAWLDRARVDHLTSLYVPPLSQLDDLASFDTLRYIVMRLRGEGGCPWDREQSHVSLRPSVIEEAYEVGEAVDRGIESDDWSPLAEEIGDLMMNLLLHAQIGAESEQFWLEDALRAVNAKLIRRHPHVFGDLPVSGIDEVWANWDRIKRAEKGERAAASRLGELPAALPALSRAQTMGRRARRAGFAWADVGGAWDKLSEELAELRAAATTGALAEELGDVLWMVATLADYLDVDAEEALRQATRKFQRRFLGMEQLASAAGEDFPTLGLARQSALWQQVKDAESA